MADRVSKEVRSRIMARIRGKNTGIELTVFRALRAYGVGFVRHYAKVPGKPDVALPARKLAVFLDGDFWHGYRYPTWRKKISQKFWRDKIERNRTRDRRNFARLRRHGWRVLRVWEHEIERDPFVAVQKIRRFLKSRR